MGISFIYYQVGSIKRKKIRENQRGGFETTTKQSCCSASPKALPAEPGEVKAEGVALIGKEIGKSHHAPRSSLIFFIMAGMTSWTSPMMP